MEQQVVRAVQTIVDEKYVTHGEINLYWQLAPSTLEASDTSRKHVPARSSSPRIRFPALLSPSFSRVVEA
jgi:hypothetical protein